MGLLFILKLEIMRKRIYSYVILLGIFTLSFTSCDNAQLLVESSQDILLEGLGNDTLILAEEEVQDTTLYYINTENDLSFLLQRMHSKREKYMISQGWRKVDVLLESLKTKATVQEYSVDKSQGYPVENSRFKTKFSQNMINEINKLYNAASVPLSSKKTYICGWSEYSAYVNLQANQKPGALPSPLCGFVPNTKTNYTDRGYESYVNAGNQFIMQTQVLTILYEDVKKPTIFSFLCSPRTNVFERVQVRNAP